jgi:hypothetical protein
MAYSVGINAKLYLSDDFQIADQGSKGSTENMRSKIVSYQNIKAFQDCGFSQHGTKEHA